MITWPGMPHLSTEGDAQGVGVLRHDELRHVRQRHGRRHRLLLLRPGLGGLSSHRSQSVSPLTLQAAEPCMRSCSKQPLGLEVCIDVQDTMCTAQR